jgi:hypothetical protein
MIPYYRARRRQRAQARPAKSDPDAAQELSAVRPEGNVFHTLHTVTQKFSDTRDRTAAGYHYPWPAIRLFRKLPM